MPIFKLGWRAGSDLWRKPFVTYQSDNALRGLLDQAFLMEVHGQKLPIFDALEFQLSASIPPSASTWSLLGTAQLGVNQYPAVIEDCGDLDLAPELTND